MQAWIDAPDIVKMIVTMVCGIVVFALLSSGEDTGGTG